MATQLNLILLSFHPFSIASLLLFLLFIYKWISETSVPKKNTPPSPPRLPIIGNLHQLGVLPHRSLWSLSKKYGDLMLLHLGSRPTIVVSSAELASKILKTHDLVFASRPQLSSFKRLLANGKDILASPYGEHWKQVRGISVLQLLSSQRIRSFRKTREEEVAMMMKSIEGLSTVNLSEMFISLTNDVICRVAFGKKYRGEDGGTDMKKMMNEMTEVLACYCVGDYVRCLAWIDRINGMDAKIEKVSSMFDDFLERILEDHLNRKRDLDDDGEDKDSKSNDLVDVLLKAQREGGSGSSFLDKESIKGLILDMFVGGTAPTYVALEWVISELLRNTRVMKKLKQEVRRISGGKEGVTEDGLEKMAYLKAVIKESLRLHPPAPLMAPHESREDVKINGYDIVTGTQVMVNIWSITRNPAYWDEPEKFYPERFIDSPIDFKGQNFEFTPFGSGRRICPGITFAVANIELVIANLLYCFDWALPKGEDEESLDMAESSGLAAHRKTPLIATPILRFGREV